jgi:thiosulfate dehydrogenase
MTNTRKVIIFSFITISLILSDSFYKYNFSQPEKKEITHPWKFPDETQIPSGTEGEHIRYGQQLINETSKYLGPEVKNKNMRFSGSNMSCKNCHLAGGTKPFSAGYVGVYGRFPQFRVRSNIVETIENRINGCFERSLNGRAIPFDSKEMKAIVMYMKWLSTDIPVGGKVDGQGLVKLPLLDRAASPEAGKKVFQQRCTVCHGTNGLGIRNGKPGSAAGYIYPPLWGNDSYNTGAAMYRLMTIAGFIKAKMPFDNPDLTDEQAYDVAAFVISRDRPKKPGTEKDFPILKFKPLDTPYPPFNDQFSAKQHKYGPFQPMIKDN